MTAVSPQERRQQVQRTVDACSPHVSNSSSMELISQVKDQVKLNTHKVEYDVSKFYHKQGFSQWLARHPRFEHLTLLVIGLNALWIWIDTDLNPGPMLIMSPPAFQIVEHLFCFYFSYEWIIRFLAFKNKRNGLRDFWFVFDSLLVWTMMFETWLMSAVFLAAMGDGSAAMGNASFLRIARLLRLTRMARMARLLRALPELLILIKGMVAALRSVCFALGLLGLIVYVFGIAFTQLAEDTPLEPWFRTVMVSMHTLIVYGALMDEISSLIPEIEQESIILLLLFYLFVLLAALTVMNMLIGVICEMVLKVGADERQQATKCFVEDKLTELMMTGTDENDDNLISKNEFMKMLQNKRATDILHQLGIDVIGLVDFADTIFEPMPGKEELGEKQLTLAEFTNVILELRGGQNAKFCDMLEMRKYINCCFSRLERRLFDMEFAGRLHAKEISGNTSKETEKPVSRESSFPSVPVTELCNSIVVALETKCSSSSIWGSPRSNVPLDKEPMSVKVLQEQINECLGKVQLRHERELASLHAENLKLLDRLRDLSAVAGRSLGAVMQVAASVPSPRTESQLALLPMAEQPQVQGVGMDGIPKVQPMPRQAAVDPRRGSMEPAKQETGSHRLSMDMLIEEARKSLATNG